MYYNNRIVQEDMRCLAKREEIPVELLKGKRILITGANGMLATYLIYFFMFLNEEKSYGIEVYALTRNKEKAEARFSSFIGKDCFSLIFQDVCDSIALPESSVDYIIHAAGNASPRYILEDPVGIIKANTIGTINILEFAKKQESVKVAYLSTREIYGKMAEEVEIIGENQYGVMDPTELRSCYPESKRIAETILESYRHQYGIDYVTLRIAHSYGPGMIINNDGRVMADFISDIVQKRDIVLKSTGDAIRAFCYITDAIAGVLIALLKGESGRAYNLANENEPRPIREAAELLTELFPERGCKVRYQIPEVMSEGYSKMGRVKLDVQELNKLGWDCRVNLQTGLRNTVLSFEDDV
ncbi:dTDP-glucose 4,6-dehydratase [Lachnospiraceae bacterium]|nr:dTDP-glucose 4,6-dehydratase [Lachnospiraceae bacterium]